MKKHLLGVCLLLMSASFQFLLAQNKSDGGVTPTSPISPNPVSNEVFRFKQGLVTHLIGGNLPTSSTNGFTASDQWLSFGEILPGSGQVLQGFRTQRNGRGFAMGLQGSNTTITPRPFIEWIGNSALNVLPSDLEFRFATSPTSASPLTVFKMEPNNAGTSANSYALNGLLGHYVSGTYGKFDPGFIWSGIGQVLPSSGISLYGARYQYDASSLITSIRQDAGAGTREALIEFGNDEANPGNFSIDELKVRYFSNPNVAASAVDFVKFVKSSRSSVFGYSTINPLSSSARVAVYDGVAALSYSNPGTPGNIESAAVYGVSSGTNEINTPRKYSAGVVGDVYNSSSFVGSYGILGIGPRS